MCTESRLHFAANLHSYNSIIMTDIQNAELAAEFNLTLQKKLYDLSPPEKPIIYEVHQPKNSMYFIAKEHR